MVCQLMRIQVEKDFAQNADAGSVAHSDRVKPALLILGDRAVGLCLGPIQEGLANARIPIRSQYPLTLR